MTAQPSITVSLEKAKSLRESGFLQDIPDDFGDEQSRWWCQYDSDEPMLLWLQSDGFNDDETYWEDHEYKILYKSPFVEEILCRLPDTIKTGNDKHHTSADLKIIPSGDGRWCIEYESFCCSSSDTFISYCEKTLADAAASMYIELSKRNLLPQDSHE